MVSGMFGSPGQKELMGRLAQIIAGRSVLADEIANLDTPGYRAQGASAFEAQMQAAVTAQLGGTTPAGAQNGLVPAVPAALLPLVSGATTGGAILPLSAMASGGSGVLTPDGNGMSLDALMAQLGQTDLDYQAVSRQLQLTYTNLSEAIDKGGA